MKLRELLFNRHRRDVEHDTANVNVKNAKRENMKKKVNPQPPLFEVVRTLDMAEIPLETDVPSYRFRIELLKQLGHTRYHARVYRKETFRVQPTFPQKEGKPRYEPSDEEIFVEDILERWEGISGRTAKDVLDQVLRKLKQTFRKKEE